MSTGEMARQMANLSTVVDKLRTDLQPVITRDAVDAERFRQIDRRLDELEGWQTWATRLALGAIILGVIGIAFTIG